MATGALKRYKLNQDYAQVLQNLQSGNPLTVEDCFKAPGGRKAVTDTAERERNEKFLDALVAAGLLSSDDHAVSWVEKP